MRRMNKIQAARRERSNDLVAIDLPQSLSKTRLNERMIKLPGSDVSSEA